jgi:hypothetical protein
VEQHNDTQALDDAIDNLVDAMSRVEPAVFHESACDKANRTRDTQRRRESGLATWRSSFMG